MNDITIFVISDSIGETAGKIARSCIKQFSPDAYEIKRFPYVDSKDKIFNVFEKAKLVPSVVIFTTVLEEHAQYIEALGKKYNIPTVNVMSKVLESIESVLHQAPIREAGLIRRLDQEYFDKVSAIEFAVKYDDGKDPRGIILADVVLLGISRTSKTPLSMYLANKNYKVANVPLLPEIEPSEFLYEKDKRRIFGLIASDRKINEIRIERMKSLGIEDIGNYACTDRINEELRYSKEIMGKLGCQVIDVTNKAIEETASIIIDSLTKNFGEIDD